jgi:thiosulfate/3-mercaptopyruvate sulfurtransferase
VTLVDVPSLAARIHLPDPAQPSPDADRLAPDTPVVLDVRWRLGGPPGLDDYLTAHIPGAVFIDLDRDVCGPPGVHGRHPLPEAPVLEKALREAGVSAGRPVVVYDGGDGLAAARLWWTLRWAGLTDVQVLDGGFAAWVDAGQPVESGAVAVPPGDVVVRPGGMPVLDPAGAAKLAREGVLLDARAAARYRGEVEPIDPVAGHIPGAVNLPVTELVQPSGRLRPVDQLRSVFAQALEGAAVRAQTSDAPGRAQTSDAPVRAQVAVPAVGAYCGSGVTAAQTVLALQLVGIEAALYVGSWSEWVADPERPVATGEHHPSTVEEHRVEGA